MDFKNDIGKQIEAWKNENDNRAAIVLLVERENEQEERWDYATEGCVLGRRDILVDALSIIAEDKEQKLLGSLLRHCLRQMMLNVIRERMTEQKKE